MMKKFLLWSIVFLIIINGTLALGIRPAKTEITFMPGLVQNYSFKIVNNDNKSLNVIIYAEGDLKDYIKLHGTEAHLGIGEEFKETSFSVELPPEPSLEMKTAQIVVEEIPGTEIEKQTFSTKIKIVHSVNVNIPEQYFKPNISYKKSIEANLSYLEAEEGILVIIDVINTGNSDINSIEGRISLFDAKKEIISTTIGKKEIKQGSSTTLIAVLNKTLTGIGIYNLRALISYDEEDIELSREIVIGKPNINLLDYTNRLIAGKIGTLEINLENEWNVAQEGFAEIFISNGTNTIYSKTPYFNIPPRKTTKIKQYIDFREFSAGNYNSRIAIHFNNLTKSENFTLHLLSIEEYIRELAYLKERIKKIKLICLMAIIVLISIQLFLWFFFRKR